MAPMARGFGVGVMTKLGLCERTEKLDLGHICLFLSVDCPFGFRNPVGFAYAAKRVRPRFADLHFPAAGSSEAISDGRDSRCHIAVHRVSHGACCEGFWMV